MGKEIKVELSNTKLGMVMKWLQLERKEEEEEEEDGAATLLLATFAMLNNVVLALWLGSYDEWCGQVLCV